MALLLFPCGLYASNDVVPDVPADYIIAGNLNHELGQRWLKARGLKGQNEFEQSRIQYITLLESYPDLIQARFEYVQVLQVLGRFKEMAVELEILLDLDPDNVRYKQKLGTLLLEYGHENQGVLLLEDVWQERQDVALGQLLYRTYVKRGLKKKALPILEYLYKQSVNDAQLQDELFVLYIDLDNDQKAQNFAPVLSEKTVHPLSRLILAAHLYERLGLDHLAADYWQAVLKQQPDYQLAHENLVRYYTANSRDGEALPHKIFLYSHTDDDGEIAGEIGDHYVQVSECKQAVFFLKRSLLASPNQVDRQRKLAYCYKAIGETIEAAHAFNEYFKLQSSPSSEDRLNGAIVFDAASMFSKAAYQYRQLLVETPGDVEILSALARVETARGNYDEALTCWKQVAQRKPDDVACRIQILDLSDRLRIDDVHEILVEIHALDQNNHKVSLLLALAALKNGNIEQGLKLFAPLAQRELFSADLLALRGEIFLMLGQPEHSFKDFTEALTKAPDVPVSVVPRLLQVAGILGRLDIVYDLNAKHHFSESGDLSVVLIYAHALAESGDFTGSMKMYEKVIVSGNHGLSLQARQGLGRLYARYHFDYEAEQEDRINWLSSKDSKSILNVVLLALSNNNNDEAEFWLDRYTLSGEGFDSSIYYAEIQLLIADDELEQAVELGQEFDVICNESKADCTETALLIKIQSAQILFQQGEVALAFAQLEQLQHEYKGEILPLVAQLQMAVKLGDSSLRIALQDSLLRMVRADAGDMFELQTVAKEYELFNFARALNRKLYKAHPKSLKYGLALVDSLIAKSYFDEALDVILKLETMYPDTFLLSLNGAEISLAMGEFNQGLTFIAKVEQTDFYREELVRTRLLWGDFQYDEALRIYENNLTPEVEDSFLSECKVLGVSELPDQNPSLWLRVVGPMADKPSPLEKSFKSSNNRYALVGTSFFADKKWQDLFALEFEVRRAVRRRELFYAVNQFKAMGDQLTEPTLLFDLAGVYSSLNRVGDEAVIYEEINRINPDFPGLVQAMTRNELRRRPRTGVTVQYNEEDGRDGYKDIRKWQHEVRGWYSPKPRREGVIAASHLYYNGDKGKSVRGYKMEMGVSSNVLDHFQLEMNGGVHLLGDDYPNKGVFNVSITGMAGDFLESYFGMKRRVVNDTLASLHRGIIKDEYTARATVDLFPRLHIGGELIFADYSDDNDMSGYSFWGILILQTQPDYVYFRFGYEFVDHKNGAGGSGAFLEDGFQGDDHPYWSPVNYWCNQYTMGYKHTYADNILGHQIPGFLSANYSIDYDSEGDLFHHVSTGVHLEITPSWLFSFNGSVDLGDEYDGYNLDTTLEYRW